jgi:hypothetical protein
MGCGPSDEEVLKGAESVVKSFVDELNMENFESAKEIYPDLSFIKRYKIPYNFKITNSKFSSDEKKEIKVAGSYESDGNNKPLQFVLKKDDNNKWFISRSKGLSSYYEGYTYVVLKKSGCLKDIESDASIHKTCVDLEPKVESLVTQYKNDIESLILFDKGSSNLTNNYNINISGDLMLKNTSNITIPGFSYEIYIQSFDSNGNLSHSSKYEFNNKPILANSDHQIRVFAMDYNKDYRTYRAVVVITNDEFIRNYISQNEKIICSM